MTRQPLLGHISDQVVNLVRGLLGVSKVNPLQFFLGPAGSGAPLHWHDAALNFLAFGEKKWFLEPPTSPFASYSNEPVLAWLSLHNGAVNSMQCTQLPGDLLFVPKDWSHATLNTRTAIGMKTRLYLTLFRAPILC